MTKNKNISNLSPSALVSRSEKIVSSEIDGETVMMSVDMGSYYGLNEIGTRIWELIESPRTISDICDQLTKEYKVEPETCRKEIFDFLSTLTEEEIVEVK